MSNVYILCSYDERGIYNALATMRRDSLLGILLDRCPVAAEEATTLVGLLEKPDNVLADPNGWDLAQAKRGGLKLYVIPLQ